MPFTIAIDGPVAAGKGTIARALGDSLAIAVLDTGLLYRATGRRALAGEDAAAAARDLQLADLERPELRHPEIAQEGSRVSAIPEVRRALLDFQRAFARRDGGAILDGRDIGTVVCPEAELKLFITAADTVRAQRRHTELAAAGGESPDYATVLAELRERDARDSGRATAPLTPAEDAVRLDTTDLAIAEAVAVAERLATARR